MPVVLITAPMSFFACPCIVPYSYVFGMPACAFTWVSVDFVHSDVLRMIFVVCVPAIEGYGFEGVPESMDSGARRTEVCFEIVDNNPSSFLTLRFTV